MDYFSALCVLFSAVYFGEVATQAMNFTTDNTTAGEFNMTTPEVYNTTTGFMNDTEFDITTTELYPNTTELYPNTTELYPNTTELYPNTTELYPNTTEFNTTVGDFFTNSTTEAFGVKGDNMFRDGEKNLMVPLGIVIAINCVGVVVFVVWIVRKCLRDKARKTATRFYQYDNKAVADDISVDTSSKRKLSTIAESDHESVAETLKSTGSKSTAEPQADSEEPRDARVMELSRLSSLSTRAHGSESENV